MTTTLAPPDAWLDELPPAYVPEGFREALDHETAQRTTYEARTVALSAARADLAVLATYADALPSELRSAALDVLAAEAVLAATPTPAPVPDHYAAFIVECIQGWFAERPARLGSPPLIFAEARHFLEAHQGELTPRATDRERAVLDAFSAVAADLHGMRATLALYSRPLDSEPIEQRAQAFLGFREKWEEHVALVTRCRESVDAVDAERMSSPDLHRCRLWGGAHVAPLMPVDEFVTQIGPWSEKRALLDGFPARAAGA
jgi:hypothetical protein